MVGNWDPGALIKGWLERRTAGETAVRSLNSHLTAIVLAALLPTIGAAVLAVWWAVTAFHQASADRLVATARTISQGIYGELQSRLSSVETLGLDPLLMGTDPLIESAQLRDIEARFGGRFVVLHRPEADRVAALRKLMVAGIPYSVARDLLGSDRAHFSDLFTPQGGKPSLAVAVRIDAYGQGADRRMVWFAPATRVVRSLQQGGAIGERILTAVTDGTGHILARSREPEKFVGRSVPDWARLKATGNIEGAFDAKTLEGGKVKFSFRRIPGTPGWMVVVGEPLEAVNARWIQPVVALTIVAIAAILAGLVLVRRLKRAILGPVHSLAERARALAVDGGLLDLRSAPEIHSSTVAEFEAMRRSLEASEAALRDQAQAIARSERRYRCLAETGALVFWSRAATGELRSIAGWNEITGQSDEDALGRGWLEMVHPADIPTVESNWLRALAAQGAVDVEFRIRSASGGWQWVRARGTLFAGERGTLPEWIGVLEDVDERRQAEIRIAEMALRDALTGLANRVVFRQKVEEAVASARPDRVCAVHYIDLDRFKAVNDTLGHPVGDALLQAVAERLLALVGEADTVARIGGDEFAVVQQRAGSAAASEQLARRIVDAICRPFDIEGHRIEIGASVGVTVITGSDGNAEQVIRDADRALYEAKSGGRGQFRLRAANG
jgi:diguanylate cyclase (GGDEF)-like protein/PAS domain S-box-containing protein